ncbi:CiaD-like domain-containing protein [Helicobacter pylori]|uniref:CiaD-like domain-containing protein n=1 Tax=Helicobacter pylori TaxID=210 RepID=UPI003466E90D
MELKNIISETLNEIEKMAKTIDNNFDAVQKTPSFFKTPPHLQNTPNPKNANTPLEPKNAAKIETQEKITEENTEEKEEEAQEIITEEITPKNPTQALIPNERVFLKNLLERTLVLLKGMQALEEKDALKRLDLVVRFLQYQLSVLEKRLESLERETQSER